MTQTTPTRDERELAQRREQKKRQRARYKERDAEKEKLRHFLYRKRKGGKFDRERYNAWLAENPGKLLDKYKRRRQRDGHRERNLMHGRKWYVNSYPDQAGVQKRITANAARVVPASLGPANSDRLTSELVKAVYSGRFPIRLTAEHSAEIMRELKMEHSNG